MQESIEEAIGLYMQEHEKNEDLESQISELTNRIDELEDELEQLKRVKASK